MQAPWERYQPQPSAVPTVIEGPERTPPPQTQTQSDTDAANLERIRLENAERRRALEAGAEAAQTQENERKSAGFLRRALGANQSYEGLNIGPRSLLGQTLADTIPDILNALPRSVGNSQDRQVSDTNQREFIMATLRQESGAAIPESEIESQRRLYFPTPGEGPDAIAEKREARRRAIEALVSSTGQAMPPEIREQLGAWLATFERNNRTAIDPETGEEMIVVGEGVYDPSDPNNIPSPDSSPSTMHSLGVGVGGLVEGVGDIFGLVGNPLNHGINALLGTELSTDIGRTFREASGLPEPVGAAESLGAAINSAGAGALTLAGAANAAAPLATNALQGALARFGSSPMVDTFAGATSGASAELARQAGVGPVGQILAALAGGGLGGFGAARTANRFNPTLPPENALVRAGREEGVDVNRVMVDPSRQHRATGVEATIAGGPRMRAGMNRVRGQIEGRVRRLGRGGTAMDDDNAGNVIREASERSIRNSGRRAGDLYDAAETASEGVRVQPQQSTQVIDEVLNRLRETPESNGAEIAFLERLRNDFTRDLSVGALRRVRTRLRGQIRNGGLTFGEDEANVLAIMDSASQDIERGLREAGRGQAAQLFRNADDFYRDRMQFIEGTIQRLIGRRNANLSPGQIAQNFRGMAKPRGDHAALARMMREMEPEEQADIAATFAEALGRNNRGDFSTAHFVREIEKLPRAAQLNLFGENGVRSLQNLRDLAASHARVTDNFNPSRTGVANDWRSIVSNVIFGGGVGFATDSGLTGMAVVATGAGAKAARDVLSARSLLSTNLTSWARNAPRTTNPRVISRHLERLGTIAAREPALAVEIGHLQQALVRMLNTSALPAAASGTDGQEGR